jgi:hypothetical protein
MASSETQATELVEACPLYLPRVRGLVLCFDINC